MTVNPSPMKRAFVCPLCADTIEAMEPHETLDAPPPVGWVWPSGDDPSVAIEATVRFRMAQNMEANEALIWAHFESHHTLRQAVLALGVARNALFEIRPAAMANDIDTVLEAVERGLGNV